MNKKLHNSQSGVAHLALIVVLVLVIVGAAGYYVWNNNKDKNSGSNSQTVSNEEAEAECNRQIDDEDLCKMASSVDYDKENYVLTITGTQEGQQYSWTVQNDGENVSSSMLGLETVTYNGDSYVKGADGEWVKYPKSENPAADEEDDFTDELNFSDEEASWYTKVGKEPCGEMTCFHYSYKDPNDASNNAEFYFDDEDYKIRKVTTTDEDGNSVVMTITYGNAKVSPPENYTSSTD